MIEVIIAVGSVLTLQLSVIDKSSRTQYALIVASLYRICLQLTRP